MKLERVVADYIVWHEVSGHSAATVSWYRWILGTFQRWLEAEGRSTNLQALTIADVRAFLQAEGQRDTLCPDHPTGVQRAGKLSDRTLNAYARAIRAFFNWCVAEEYLSKTPVARLKPQKLEKRMKQVLSVREVETLLAALNQNTFLGSRMYAMVALFYDTGIRAAELCNLDLGDVFWTEYQLKVKGKGKKQRLVPFSRETQRALRKYLQHRPRFAVEGSTALFITPEGQRLTVNGMRHALKRLGVRTGIERLHPHLLRHSAAVAAVLNGASQFELKRMLGHEELSTTDVYMDLTEQMLADQHKKFSPMAKVNMRRATMPRATKKR